MGQTSYSVYVICPEAYELLDDAQALCEAWGYETLDELNDDFGTEITQGQLSALKSKFIYVPSRDAYACLSQEWVAADLEFVLGIFLDECNPYADYTVIYFSTEVWDII